MSRAARLAVRAIEEHEADAVVDTFSVVFGLDRNQEQRARFRRIFELDRARCAFEGEQMVGTAGAFSLLLTVPGGTVQCAGTTIVSVLPTHRRRGVMSRMMAAHLDDVRQREEPLAALWASESSIYGRFGFGQASETVDLTIPRTHVDFHRLAAPPAEVRLIDATEATRVLPRLFERARPRWPGCFARSPVWWEVRHFRDDPDDREGASPYRYAVAYELDRPVGYCQYRFKLEWPEAHAAGKVVVSELVTLTPGAAAGLWGYLLSHDLSKEVGARLRPAADPVVDLLSDPRRAERRPGDGICVRIVDLPRALEARRYSADGRLTLEVRDPLEKAPRRFALESDGGDATCRPTTRRPDLSLDVEDLGACYLGRSRFAELAEVGRVVGTPAALRRADALFTWHPQPWCPEIF